MTNRDHQDYMYSGLLGLDGIPFMLKGLNLLLTVGLGTLLAFESWSYELYSNPAIYHFQPISWPVLLLLAWPTCAIPLWLRLTGIRWRWGFLAAVLVLLIYFLVSAIFRTIGNMMA